MTELVFDNLITLKVGVTHNTYPKMYQVIVPRDATEDGQSRYYYSVNLIDVVLEALAIHPSINSLDMDEGDDDISEKDVKTVHQIINKHLAEYRKEDEDGKKEIKQF